MPPAATGGQLAALSRLDRLSVFRPDLVSGTTMNRAMMGTLAAYDGPGLRQYFTAMAQVSGERPGDGIDESLRDAETEAVRIGATAIRPSTEQIRAMRRLDATAITNVSMTWNAITGTPRRVSGVLYVRRDLGTQAIARSFLTAEWTTLAQLLATDTQDTLESDVVSAYPDRGLESVRFVRFRKGFGVIGDVVDVYVTTDENRLGPGVVTAIRFEWDHDVEDMPIAANRITPERARRVASIALGRDLATAIDVSTTLEVHCLPDGAGRRSCVPLYRVRDARRRDDTSFAAHERPDTALVHAATGALVTTDRAVGHSAGAVTMDANYPYQALDDVRALPFASVSASVCEGTPEDPMCRATAFATGTDGRYTTSAIGTAQVSLASIGSLTGLSNDIRLTPDGNCGGSPSLDWTEAFTLGGNYHVQAVPDAMSCRRTYHLGYHWLSRMYEMLRTDFLGVVQVPRRTSLWFIPSTNGVTGTCPGPAGGTSTLVQCYDDQPANSPAVRAQFGHEISHGLYFCTDVPGAECGLVCPNGPSPTTLPEAATEGFQTAFGNWWSEYENPREGMNTERHRQYAGPNVAGDIVVYATEIEGTPAAAGSSGCDPDREFGVYNCSATEACWTSAEGRPRCMLRAANQAACDMAFPTQPPGYVFFANVGRDGGPARGIGICVTLEYSSGRLFENLGLDLWGRAGYQWGTRAMFGMITNTTCDRELTRGTNSYFLESALWSGEYEVSRAFHGASSESFRWLDDTTDRRVAAEVLRLPRGQPLFFSEGGATRTPLRFDNNHDWDVYLLPATRGQNYLVTATSLDMQVDLCTLAFGWQTGTLLSTSPGCSDGSDTQARRNADLPVQGQEQEPVVILAASRLQAVGRYDLVVQQLDDDYPNSLADLATAQPIGYAVAVIEPGELTAGDHDLFRYDVSTSGSGTIVVNVYGPDPPPRIEVYAANGTSPPSSGLYADGAGRVEFVGTPDTRYYLLVSPTGAGVGAYNIAVTNNTCPTCSAAGTYASPTPLPTPLGGIVMDRLDHGTQEVGFSSPAQCANGTACDWYGVELQGNERVTVAANRVWDDLCRLEVAVLPPPEWGQFNIPTGGERQPIVFDQGGSMEDNGAQLTYVARRAGAYRIRVRANGTSECPRYELSVVRGAMDERAPPVPR